MTENMSLPSALSPIINSTNKYYSAKGLWTLFLMCALPQHIWTLILAFNDISWVTERTNAWDAIGVMSYGLVYAFLECLVIFLTVSTLGLLILNKFSEVQRVVILSVLILILSIWGIANHLYFLTSFSLPSAWLGFIASFGHPLRTIYILAIIAVSLSLGIPVYAALKSEKFFRLLQEGIDRLSLLMTIYLFADLAAVIIIIIRNI